MNTELHEIRDAIEQSETVTGHKNVAAEADRNAKEHLQTCEVAQTAVKQIQADWVRLLEQFERLKAESASAGDAHEWGKTELNRRRETYFNWQHAVSNLEFLKGATHVAELVAALPILKERLAWKRKVLADHVKTMRNFGADHGIDPEILNQLSGAIG